MNEEALSKANLAAGRMLFGKTCSNCHRLYGDGQTVGPDLTGAQRSSLDYLLTNILDPSAVVGKEYRMSTILDVNGRVLNGLIVSKDASRLVLQTATEKLTMAMDEIEMIKESSLSAMPDGLLQTLSEEQVRDLVGYLQHAVQVPLPK